MAFMQIHTRSQALGMVVNLNVLLPEGDTPARQRELPVIWLLHGYSDDHTIWMRRTALERHREQFASEFAIVMPAVDLSFYADMHQGNRYWTYLSDELPTLLGSMLPLSTRREDQYAAGLSMGGYGAIKLAFAHPERFGGCASLSGALDILGNTHQLDAHLVAQMQRIFGSPEQVRGTVSDLFYTTAQAVAAGGDIPAVYACCGTDDFLWEQNQAFLAHAHAIGLPVRWEQDEGFAHTWDYWDLKIQTVLAWFAALRNQAKGTPAT